MSGRRHKHLILKKAPVPYRVICLGSDLTYGHVGGSTTPPYDPIPGGVGYVERMAQRMAPYYEFVTAAAPHCTVLDFINSVASPDPDFAYLGGAYETLVEPYLEPATGQAIDMATLFFGFIDAAKLPVSGLGWFESAPVPWPVYLSAFLTLTQKLLDSGVGRVLWITPLRWDDPSPPSTVVEDRLLAYRTVLAGTVNQGIASAAVSYLDIYNLLPQSTYFVETEPSAWWWPTQAGHDRLAAVVGRHIRQGMHYDFSHEDVGSPPLKETMSYKPAAVP